MLSDVADAVRAVHTYHIVADLPGGVHADLRIGGTALVVGRMTIHGASADLVIDQNGAYVHGRDYFRETGGDRVANAVGDRWVLLPATTYRQLSSSLASFTDTTTLAHCIVGEPAGTLTVLATTVSGRPVVEIDDAGDKPGSQKGSLVVDAATALPVEERWDGAPSPGGPPLDPECGGRSTVASGSALATFDQWGSPVAATAPPSPLDLSKAAG